MEEEEISTIGLDLLHVIERYLELFVGEMVWVVYSGFLRHMFGIHMVGKLFSRIEHLSKLYAL